MAIDIEFGIRVILYTTIALLVALFVIVYIQSDNLYITLLWIIFAIFQDYGVIQINSKYLALEAVSNIISAIVFALITALSTYLISSYLFSIRSGSKSIKSKRSIKAYIVFYSKITLELIRLLSERDDILFIFKPEDERHVERFDINYITVSNINKEFISALNSRGSTFILCADNDYDNVLAATIIKATDPSAKIVSIVNDIKSIEVIKLSGVSKTILPEIEASRDIVDVLKDRLSLKSINNKP
ncbi:MAG: hypothetical protein ARM1_0468 [Candidatus Micrarchaeota archaeon]|nr:MAG: hypothetical protein ARM1_0468 [Candidatus Micrarchaeota archaeon]